MVDENFHSGIHGSNVEMALTLSGIAVLCLERKQGVFIPSSPICMIVVEYSMTDCFIL